MGLRHPRLTPWSFLSKNMVMVWTVFACLAMCSAVWTSVLCYLQSAPSGWCSMLSMCGPSAGEDGVGSSQQAPGKAHGWHWRRAWHSAHGESDHQCWMLRLCFLSYVGEEGNGVQQRGRLGVLRDKVQVCREKSDPSRYISCTPLLGGGARGQEHRGCRNPESRTGVRWPLVSVT